MVWELIVRRTRLAGLVGLVAGSTWLGLSHLAGGDLPAVAAAEQQAAPALGNAMAPEAPVHTAIQPRIRPLHSKPEAKKQTEPTVSAAALPLAKSQDTQAERWAIPAGRIDLRRATVEGEHLVQRLHDGTRLQLTLDPYLHRSAQKVLEDYKVAYGAIVALDPRTGHILALAEHAHERPELRQLALQAEGPAASIFKVISAAALVEHGGLEASTEICVHGGRRKLSTEHLIDNKRKDKHCISLARALGESNNVAFGRWADRLLEPQTLQATANQFLFNARLPFVWGVGVSQARIPTGSRLGFARAAAGFQSSTLSPLHAAMITGTIANQGVMMTPKLVARATQGDTELYRSVVSELARPISPEVAEQVSNMMLSTIAEGGTARRFFTKKKKLRYPGLSIAGKTGHLMRHEPSSSRSFSWFVSFWPADAPEVAVAALIVNEEVWTIKGVVAARAVIEAWQQRQHTVGRK